MVASRGSPPVIPALTIVVAMLMAATCVYVYNDICDLEMDKLNPRKIKNPIPSGKISVKEAMRVVYFSGVAGLVLSFLAGIAPFILTAVYMALFLSYSHPAIRLKKKFLIKEATLSAGLLLSIIVGSITVGSVTLPVIFLGAFIAVFSFTASPSLNDMQDRNEDEKFGVKSLASILAWKTKLEMLITVVIIFMLLTPLTYVNLGLNVLFPIVSLFLSLLFLRYLFPIISEYEIKGWQKAFKSAFIYFFGIPIAFILGALPVL